MRSTFGCQSCTKSQVERPLSTPSTGIPEVCRRFNNIKNNNSHSGLKRLGSPRRFLKQESNEEIIGQPQNQFSNKKISKTGELGLNTKPSQPAIRCE